MPSATNINLKLQTGSDNTYYASWDFNETTKSPTPSNTTIKAGALVSIKAGATYYNGVDIPAWVMNQKWKITEISGDRAVLGKNANGTNDICSPINIKYLVGESSTATEVSKNTVDYYMVAWKYDTGDNTWFSGDSSNVKEKKATYSPPSNTIRIKFLVKPVSKKHKVNNKDVSYWTGTTVSKEYSLSADPPETPSVPNVTIEKYKLTALLENIADARTDKIQFEVYGGTKITKNSTVTVLTRRAIFSCDIEAGGIYRVRCRSINLNGKSTIYGQWSDFSSNVGTMPSAPSAITSCKASSETSVRLEWSKVNGATSYNIEYSTKKEYFNGSDQTTTVTGIEFARYEKTGLESGEKYFFRVRAVNDKGESAWSKLVSIIIGKSPAAPTTWSSTTTVITGEPLTLYWMHNSEDGSNQTKAELELYINGVKSSHIITNSKNEDSVSSYLITTSKYIEGSIIKWRVRTAGVTTVYGDWSIQRTIDIYAPITLTLNMTDSEGASIETLKSFPFYITGTVGPKTQVPIGYHLTITSNEIYRTIDQVGIAKIVNKGEAVYSEYFDNSDLLLVELSANNIDVESDISYTVTCLVSMNSGLTAEASLDFFVEWSEPQYEPDAEIGIDSNSFSSYIRPYCINEKEEPINDVLLSVYRREFDGDFAELATGIINATNTYIIDPHPALDYARYRIVATSKTTGAVNYYDAPGYPVGNTSIIIQWNEDWTNFDTTSEAELVQPPWSGSLLKLPYNISVSDKNDLDVSLIEYIGRKRPVSYYGTQLGETSTWKVDILKNDNETLYALRKLAIWTGDAYVREPSGSGYWANISVSFNQTHRELTIPVTLEIVRVEGGI